MMYYTTPYFSVAMNHKVGSSSVAAAIAEKFYPEIFVQVIMMPVQFRFIIPKEAEPTKPTVLLLRDPVERFLSACATRNCTVEEGLESDDPHFEFQGNADHIFRFPEQIPEFCALVGIDKLTHINPSQREKHILTQEQLSKVKQHYANDINLWESLDATDD